MLYDSLLLVFLFFLSFLVCGLKELPLHLCAHLLITKWFGDRLSHFLLICLSTFQVLYFQGNLLLRGELRLELGCLLLCIRIWSYLIFFNKKGLNRLLHSTPLTNRRLPVILLNQIDYPRRATL